ncbi:YihY/virulence factor BrkB family protein [Prauserella cavernicola]|uniref:YihY/virulence factor BrkB family protein n=1 Tax=Prauserella cavernicola TaxID=2800127 RepID=A0A934R1L7_9PSEU|nr:YihY/virulence factor BrkB family protein [Prauserella cavernicola]MBK1789209.1 YihY/virulence factor BrkB family protein [Prauserella cavernicola]
MSRIRRLWRRVSRSRGWRRAGLTLARYRERDGDHYAAAVTFFTLLSMVPLLMIAVSVAGFVLAGDQALATQLDRALDQALPAAAADQISVIMNVVVEERGRLGVLALAVCVYSGWNWISNLRDAVTALLGQAREQRPMLRTVLADVGTLLGVGLALLVSFGLAALTGAAGTQLLAWTGLAGTTGAHVLLVAGSLLLGLVANWLVVAWCLAKLPRTRRPVTEGLRAAAGAAVGLAALQQAGGLYMRLLGHSPAVATLGALVGLLLFVYLVVRWLMLVTVWTSTREEPADGGLASEAGHASATLAAGASAGVVLRTLSGR